MLLPGAQVGVRDTPNFHAFRLSLREPLHLRARRPDPALAWFVLEQPAEFRRIVGLQEVGDVVAQGLGAGVDGVRRHFRRRDRFPVRGQLLKPEVFELHLHRTADVDLEGDHALQATMPFVPVRHFHHLASVQAEGQPVAFGDDAALAPIGLRLAQAVEVGLAEEGGGAPAFAVRLYHDLVALVDPQCASTAFFVEQAIQLAARTQVILVASDAPRVDRGQYHAADLDAGIAEACARCPFRPAYFHAQFEVGRLPALPDEKGVGLERKLRRHRAGDRPVLYGPSAWFAAPVREVFAVEDRLEPGGGFSSGKSGQNEAQEGDAGHPLNPAKKWSLSTTQNSQRRTGPRWGVRTISSRSTAAEPVGRKRRRMPVVSLGFSSTVIVCQTASPEVR